MKNEDTCLWTPEMNEANQLTRENKPERMEPGAQKDVGIGNGSV